MTIFVKNSYFSKAMKRQLFDRRGKQCEHCGVTEWLGNTDIFEIHHKNGDRYDNRLANLKILCRNCHSITFKDKCVATKRVAFRVSEKKFVSALCKSSSIWEACRRLKLAGSSSTYARAYYLINKYGIVHLKHSKHSTDFENGRLCRRCGCVLNGNPKHTLCDKCYAVESKKKHVQDCTAQRPSKRELCEKLVNGTMKSVCQLYNVSDHTVYAWRKFYGLPKKLRDIRAQYAGVAE